MPILRDHDKTLAAMAFFCGDCTATLRLEMMVPYSHDVRLDHVKDALRAAGAQLGWRQDRCPKHVEVSGG